MTTAAHNNGARPVVRVEGLQVSYGDHVALRDVTLRVDRGRVVALIGPNGAGKTTLFKALLGLVPTDQGRLFVDGRRAHGRQHAVAYVPQAGDVEHEYPVTVFDVVLMGRYGHVGWLRRPREHDRRIAREALARVRLDSLEDRPFAALSGGQRQRVFLARALAQEPTLLLMDEPFTGVDATTQEIVFDLLRELRASGTTVLVATHDLGSVPVFCDEAVLVNGTIVAHGPVDDVFRPDLLQRCFGGRLVLLEGGRVLQAAPVQSASGVEP